MEQAPDSDPANDHPMNWFHGSFSSSLPADLDDPYDHFHGCQWWEPNLEPQSPHPTPTSATPPPLPATSATTAAGFPQSEPSRKRKSSSIVSAPHNQRRRNQATEESADPLVADEERHTKKSSGQKKAPSRNGGYSHGGGGGGSKEARWAEQLLNPCASAIVAGHVYRVQHLLYVLHELASLSGDANHRLAAHGLRALARHLPPSVILPVGSSVPPAPTFATTNPKLFHNSLIRFNEISPWFSFPNALANASILRTLNSDPCKHRSNLHIIDIGVSHGVQWPTLLEALTHRPTGKPGLVRLTIVPPPISEVPVPFSVGPQGDDFLNRLLRFAKNIHLNLQIERHGDADALQALASQLGGSRRNDQDETLVVCAQFRIHQLAHHQQNDGKEEDDRTEFLQRLAEEVDPDLMVLSEYEGECGCPRCGDYAAGFSRRVEFLRKFLDTTSAAFKGRECEERKVVEGEAATALGASGEMREERERWCERMRRSGFAGVGFGEEAMDGGRALLRKYDSNWEMRVEEAGSGPISLFWKGQPILFTSLWKPLRPIKHA